MLARQRCVAVYLLLFIYRRSVVVIIVGNLMHCPHTGGHKGCCLCAKHFGPNANASQSLACSADVGWFECVLCRYITQQRKDSRETARERQLEEGERGSAVIFYSLHILNSLLRGALIIYLTQRKNSQGIRAQKWRKHSVRFASMPTHEQGLGIWLFTDTQ